VISLSWPSTMPVLSDGSLTLRPWRADDVGAVHAACQDPETQRWMDVPVPFSAHHAVEFVGVEHRPPVTLEHLADEGRAS
jgi:hypothetical protein